MITPESGGFEKSEPPLFTLSAAYKRMPPYGYDRGSLKTFL